MWLTPIMNYSQKLIDFYQQKEGGFVKLFLLLFIFLLQSTLVVAETAPRIRAIIAADTLDKSCGKGIKADVFRMQRSLEVIARKIGCQLELTVLRDESFRCESAFTWLRQLPKVSDDIVIFYYTGHGCQDGLSKPWPVLCMYNRENHPRMLGGAAVVDFLKQNTQRLGLILFDCCNRSSEKEHIAYIPRGDEVIINDSIDAHGLRKLFLYTKGLIIASAASQKEYSFNRFHTPKGGVFTIGLIDSLITNCSREQVSWKKIFSKTKKYCIDDTKDEKHGPQHLIYWLHLR